SRARDPEGARSDARPRCLQCHQRAQRPWAGVLRVRLTTEAVVDWDEAVLENDLRRMARAHAKLFFLAPHPHPCRALRYEERGNSRRALRRIRVGIDHGVIGDAAVGAELLGAVE